MLRHNNHTIPATLLTWSTIHSDPGTWNSVSGFSTQCGVHGDISCHVLYRLVIMYRAT